MAFSPRLLLNVVDDGAMTIGNFLANYNPNIKGRGTGETIPLSKSSSNCAYCPCMLVPKQKACALVTSQLTPPLYFPERHHGFVAGAGLNFAVSEAKARDIPGQVQRLVAKMHTSEYRDILVRLDYLAARESDKASLSDRTSTLDLHKGPARRKVYLRIVLIPILCRTNGRFSRFSSEPTTSAPVRARRRLHLSVTCVPPSRPSTPTLPRFVLSLRLPMVEDRYCDP